jgi:hypothetical protein
VVKNDRMNEGELRFEVTKSKINWGTYFRDLMKPAFGGAASESAGFESYSDRGPSVVACNSAGEKRVILVTKKMQEAKDRATIIEKDFKTLGAAAWCERYDAPPTFVSGRP